MYKKIRQEGIWQIIKRKAHLYLYNARFFLNALFVDKSDAIRGFETKNKFGYSKTEDITNPTVYNEGLGGDLHGLYLEIIKPYINSEINALEIGSGRGTYTRGLLPAKEVWVLEAQPRWMTRIDNFLGFSKNLRFIQVKDFSCRELPESYFDYLISTATFYLFTDQQRRAYLTNLFTKMKPGANCFIMIGDWEKYKNYVGHYPVNSGQHLTDWKYTNAQKMSDMLSEIGWHIISLDMEILKRDAIIHFRKPLI